MSATSPAAPLLASQLNDACHCIFVDRGRLDEQVRAQLGEAGLRPGMVSGSVVFVDAPHAAAMDQTIALVTRAVRSPAFERRVVDSAPAIARAARPTVGGVLGFDFHLGGPEPQLIEINTNPGGLLISLEIALAMESSCGCLHERSGCIGDAGPRVDQTADRVIASFRAEWSRARGSLPLRTIAVVDDDPAGQYLYPEFLLYRRLLEQAGYRVLIVDAASLVVQGGMLLAQGAVVDFVYNRCTDFELSEPRHAALREAYESDLAVVVPHPAAHARWSNKRVLAWLRDDALLAEAGLDPEERRHLQVTIPATEIVDQARAAEVWDRRKKLFFKPVDGFGGKAAYRGDKLTRSAFEHVLAHPYVAQAIAPTSSRRVRVADGDEAELRVDVRNFTMDGDTLLRTARLYRGQTTNFRTAGGGFAPVVTLPG